MADGSHRKTDGYSADELLRAIATLQLARPRAPRLGDAIELSRDPFDDRQLAVRSLLEPLRAADVSERTADEMSAAIHLRCEWAWHAHSVVRVRQSRRNPKTTELVRSRPSEGSLTSRQHRPKQQLKRLEAAARGTLTDYVKSLAGLNSIAFNALIEAGKFEGRSLDDVRSILVDREDVSRAARQAQAAFEGRPPLPAHDAAVQLIQRCFRVLTASSAAGSGRVTDGIDGRPTGRLHALCLSIGDLYEIKLVTTSSDDRLRADREARRQRSTIRKIA